MNEHMTALLDPSLCRIFHLVETMRKVLVQPNFRLVGSRRLHLALGCALLFLLLPSTVFGEQPQKNVLLFQSDDTSLPANVLVDRAIRSTLKEGWKSPIQIYDEGQDSFRIPDEDYDAEMVNLLRRKYQKVHLDLIFAIGPPALRFLVKHQSELFSNIPIVFLATDPSRIADLTLGPNVTGVSTKVELPPTLELALAIHPQTERVVVVAGSASIDKGLLALAQQQFQAYEGRVAFTYLTDLTPEELRQRLAMLPDKTVVMFLFFNADSAGKIYLSPEVVSTLAATARAPIYASLETHLGHGIVGGRLLSFEALGVAAGQMGLRILTGESVQSIPPQTVPSVTMFDWRQLRRWSIDEAKLPPGSIVRYRQFTAWELYKWRIIGAMTLIALQTVGIIWLLFTRAKRRQAEEDNLRLARVAEAEHQRLDEVVSNVPGVVWEISIDPVSGERTTRFVSRFVEEMLGYSEEDFLSKKAFGLSLVPEEDRERVERETNEIFAAGSSGTIQYRWLTKSGREIWVEAQLAVVRDKDDRPVGVRGVTMDITDRRLAEESVRKSEERLKQAIGVAQFGVFEHDHLTGTLHASPLTREIHAWGEPDTPSFEKLLAQVHPEDREVFVAAVEGAHDPAGDGFFAREYRIVVDGDMVRWVSARARTLFEGENAERHPVRTIGAELDISERMQAEEAKNNLATIVETSDDAIVSETVEGTILSWNRGAEKIYGYAAHEIVGKNVSVLAPPELTGETLGIIDRLSRGEGVDHLETVRLSKEGNRIDVSLTISPIKNERGLIIGASTIARDITARKKAEVEELQHRTELAHLSRVTMLGELSGSLAHELNQPLTAILSNAQAAQRFLAHDDIDLDEVREILGDIVKQDKRAGEVIHRLRLLLKKSTVEHQPLDLNDVVSEVLKLVRNDLLNQSVTSQMELAPELPAVVGDRVQLQQVVLNLVMNGCDAIATGPPADRRLIIRTELNNGDGIRVSVADRGVGLAPDSLEKVFEPFFSTKPHGMGLGLSVCRTIIAAHGGKLWAANNAERGATFYFTIPTQSGLRS